MNPTIRYKSRAVVLHDGETVLDALLRAGVEVPFSCRGGVCHSCLVKCVSGTPTPQAQQGLSPRLVKAGYALACKYQPETDAVLTPRQPEDMVTACVLAECSLGDDGNLVIQFEPVSEIKYQRGDILRLVASDGAREPAFRLTSDPAADYLLQAELLPGEMSACPPWLQSGGEALAENAFGCEFEMRGPFPAGAQEQVEPLGREVRPPPPDPALWEELEQGRKVRQVLEAFYATVYADERLNSFFEGVTMARSIDKQYSFLKQGMTGEKVYMGDRPRNAHHWMVISNELFDYRQRLMVETLREHGLSEDQIARWTRYEEVFRPDIVKSEEWPRRIGGVEVMREGFAEEELMVDSVCDYCGGEIHAGTQVLFHRRLGKIGCPSCAPAVQSPAGATGRAGAAG